MATQDESDSLWDISVTSKSWVEMVEDEDVEFAQLNRSTSIKQVTSVVNGSISPEKIENNGKMGLKDDVASEAAQKLTDTFTEPRPDLLAPRSIPSIITEEESCDMGIGGLSTITEESNDSKDSPPLKNVTQTYANILKNTSEPSGTVKSENKTDRKKEGSKDFLHEDISLTGHIEGFQLSSPCKPTAGFKTPTKTLELPNIRSSPRSLKRKILQDNSGSVKIPDDVLMPSPSKIPRSNDSRLNDNNSPRPFNSGGQGTATGSGNKRFSNNRKRTRDMQTPPSNRRYRPPPDLETNEEVLARRQKQIDYGKNTIGYERYTQLVPKECRKSIHPRTPPMHLKYSRRAWEGMVRIWRQRLHFWDPPSEGGGDPACLEMEYSDMSDVSSTDGSLPSTPVQDLKRRQVYVSPAESRPKHQKADAAKSLSLETSSAVQVPNDEDDDNQGCQPLSPE